MLLKKQRIRTYIDFAQNIFLCHGPFTLSAKLKELSSKILCYRTLVSNKMAMRIFCVFFCVLLFSCVEDLFKLFLLPIFEVAEDKWFYFTCGKLKSKDLPRIILKWTNATIAIKYFYKIYIDGNFLSCLFVIVFTRYCLGIDELRTLKGL